MTILNTTHPFAVVRAKATIGARNMTNEERNIFATDISKAIASVGGGPDDCTRMHGPHKAHDMVWFTFADTRLLVSALEAVADSHWNDSIVVYSQMGLEFIRHVNVIDSEFQNVVAELLGQVQS